MFKYGSFALKWTNLLHLSKYHCFNPNLGVNHLAELTMKATRRQFLRKSVLNQDKQIIHAEIRQPSDKVLTLKQAGKCPGVILPKSGKK